MLGSWRAIGLVLLSFLVVLLLRPQQFMMSVPNSNLRLLSDPFLQLPQETSVRVVWFTEFAGTEHFVRYGEGLEERAIARSTQLTRIREDQNSKIERIPNTPIQRDIWRHEAIVEGLSRRVPYQAISVGEKGEEITSDRFTLAPLPQLGTPLKILLTSDHQLMPMTPTNLQKVVETVGRVDAVFLAGDLVNIPDRASEWFDDNRGGAFFPSLQGRATYKLNQTVYRGGELIQHAPLYTAIGNHEVMGKYSHEKELNAQFDRPLPRTVAQRLYQEAAQQINPQNDSKIKAEWIKNHSFNTDTYEELFTLPESPSGGEKYYAVTFGDIRLVVLFATNIWRSPTLDTTKMSRYREPDRLLDRPEEWGYGQHIFEPIAKGSPQYQWLETELNSPEFQQAKYKMVMFHHPPHSLGDNIVPAYTNPVPVIQSTEGKMQSVRYEYPLNKDYLIRDIEPLFDEAGVQLVYFGHSHLWNRFTNEQGIHFLESSNVGNTYGAYWGNKQRFVPEGYREIYAATGDPNGLEPVVPTLDPLKDENAESLPYIASNEISVFTILETKTGTVSSYRFDTRKPQSPVVKFDEFQLK
ncbi:metallophosphoesterase family protein [Lusitaniella coriacea]|uniref:metallophosphoesterase family protein n=1 Tax=Lusitaniella coriacea TaxID=1983105 RepID=UPI003CF3318F